MTDVENAPCDVCEKPVHLLHDPPCECGYVSCDYHHCEVCS